MISILYTYRNRGLETIRRSLDSLKNQTNNKFEVVFIDQGSELDEAQKVKDLVSSYTFTSYIYNDSRGKPFNKSHALNIGIRHTKYEKIFIADIDMIFIPSLIELLLITDLKECFWYYKIAYLPKKFNNWDLTMSKFPTKVTSTLSETGISLFNKEDLEKIYGFDEHYCFWGKEDSDVHYQLEQLGIVKKYNSEQIIAFHQYHEHLGESNLIPFQWRRYIQSYFDFHRKYKKIENKDWGRVCNPKERILLLADTKKIEYNHHPEFFSYFIDYIYKQNNLYIELLFQDKMFSQYNKPVYKFLRKLSILSKKHLKFEFELITLFHKNYTSIYKFRDNFIYYLLSHKHQIKDFHIKKHAPDSISIKLSLIK